MFIAIRCFHIYFMTLKRSKNKSLLKNKQFEKELVNYSQLNQDTANYFVFTLIFTKSLNYQSNVFTRNQLSLILMLFEEYIELLLRVL